MGEFTLDYEDALGDWGVETEEYHYQLRLWHDKDKKYRFIFKEVQKKGAEERVNALEGTWYIEVESVVLEGKNLHSSWQKDGEKLQETSLYEADPLMLLNPPDGRGYKVLQVVRNGAFKNLVTGLEFEPSVISF